MNQVNKMSFPQKLMTCLLAIIFMLSSISLPVFAVKDKSKDYQAIMDEYLEKRKETTSSVSMAIFNANERIAEKHYGYTNVEDQIAADSDLAVYEWGSVSKLLIWTSVMQCVEKGLLDLDEDISTYLPPEVLSKRKFEDPLTLTHLMNHSAGFLEMSFNSETQDPQQILSLRDALIQFAPSQVYRPGERCAYSNWGAALASYIVECVSGKSFADYTHENIFAPLGMKDTSILPDFSDNPQIQNKRHLMRGYINTLSFKEDLGENLWFIPLYPAGAACGSFDDFLRFAMALHPNSASKLFQKQETRDQFFEATLFYSETEIARNCHGMWTLPYGSGLVGHSGNTGSCSSAIYFDIESGLGYAVMTNEAGETAYNYEILADLFGEWETPHKKISKLENPPKLDSVYLSTRHSFPHGIAKLTPYIASFFYPIQEDGSQDYRLALTEGLKLRHLDSTLYLMESEDDLRFLKNLKQNGVQVLESFTNDEYAIARWQFFLKLALFFLFLLATIFSVGILLIYLLQGCVGIFSPKHRLDSEARKGKHMQSLALISILLMAVLVFTMVVSNTAFAPSTLKAMSGFCLILLLLQFALILYFRKKKIRKNIIFQIFLVISGANCLYWEWFHFWYQ